MSATVKNPVQPGDGDPRHGSASTYSNHGCRCDACCTANTAYHDEYVTRLRQRPVPEHVHGTESGYTNYACRCERCTRAQSDAAWRRSA